MWLVVDNDAKKHSQLFTICVNSEITTNTYLKKKQMSKYQFNNTVLKKKTLKKTQNICSVKCQNTSLIKGHMLPNDEQMINTQPNFPCKRGIKQANKEGIIFSLLLRLLFLFLYHKRTQTHKYTDQCIKTPLLYTKNHQI